MIVIRKETALRNLIVASLLAEGERAFSISKIKKELTCPFTIEKSYYLFNYINQHQLAKDVIVDQKKRQFKILLHEDNYAFIQNWYNERGDKIYKKYFGNEYVSYESIIIAINLFGRRKLEAIGISTSISRKHLKTLAYSFNRITNQYVYVSNKQINIPDVVNLCQNHVHKLSALDSAELISFMQTNEKEDFIMQKIGSKV